MSIIINGRTLTLGQTAVVETCIVCALRDFAKMQRTTDQDQWMDVLDDLMLLILQDEPSAAPSDAQCSADSKSVEMVIFKVMFSGLDQVARNIRLALTANEPRGTAEAVRLLTKITNLVDDEDAGEPLDHAIRWANEALAALSLSRPK